MDGDRYDTSDRSSDDSLSSTHVAAYDYARLNEALLTNKVMLFAYATSIIIVALGSVSLVVAIVLLAFYYPEKADAFVKMLLLLAPMMGILIANVSKIKSATKKIANVKPANQTDS
jgi:hypothetical protein